MDDKLVRSIRERLESKSTEELVEAYARHNTDDWSHEAFSAMAEILNKRNVPLPSYDESTTRPQGPVPRPPIWRYFAVLVLTLLVYLGGFVLLGYFSRATGGAGGLVPPIWWAYCAFLCAVVAHEKHRNAGRWAVAGFLLSILPLTGGAAILAVAAVPYADRRTETA